jgi:hypothetical protein
MVENYIMTFGLHSVVHVFFNHEIAILQLAYEGIAELAQLFNGFVGHSQFGYSRVE